MIAEDRKCIVAVLGALISVCQYLLEHDLTQWNGANWQDLIRVGAIPVLTAALVWLVPNRPAS